MTDIAELNKLVVKYKLARHIDGPFNGVLTYPEKLTLERMFGNSREDIVSFGIVTVVSILKLCLETASKLNVNGSSFLYNPVSGKKLDLPVVDSTDMLWVPALMNFTYPFKEIVMCDEAHDIDDSQAVALSSMVKQGSKLLTVDDAAQARLLAESKYYYKLSTSIDLLTSNYYRCHTMYLC